MNLAIMQPYFFPYVGYFSLFDAADNFVVYDDVNYIKKGWINRNNFLSTSGPQRFTLPICKASQNTKICNLNLHDLQDSKSEFLKMLSFSYAKAPFYQDVVALLSDIFSVRTASLTDFLISSFEKVNAYLNIHCNLLQSSKLELATDFKGEDRIIEMAKSLNAKNYINAIGGVNLYSSESFTERGLNLYFLNHKGTHYRQFQDEHIPFLSIVDVMMFNSPENALQLVKNYELKHG